MVEVEESVLIAKARDGDKIAFEKLVKKYYGRIMSYIYGMTRNRETALDYTQEVFLKAYRNIGRFKGTSSFYTWVYRIATNYSIDQFRKKKSRIDDRAEFRDELKQKNENFSEYRFQAGSMRNPFKSLSNVELRDVLFKVIESLPPKQRDVLVFREIDGLAYEEIARAVDCNIGTVMSRLFHARKKAQKLLKKYLEGGGHHE